MDYKEKIETRIALLKEDLIKYVKLVEEAQYRIPMYQAAIGELENLIKEEVLEKPAETDESIVG